MRRPVLLAALAWACVNAMFVGHVAAQQMQLEVIELHTQNADEMIQLLKPMLAPGGTISGVKDKLVIRTTPRNFADLRKILDTVDAPPRRLLITVRQDVLGQSADRELEISGSVGGANARVTVPDNASADGSAGTVTRQADGNRVRIRVDSTQSDDTGRTLQTVQVIEGRAAFISVGESVPISSQSLAIGVAGFAANDTIEYRDVESGFFAIARMRGNQVTVQLATSADTLLDRQTGAATIERISSVVSGRAGEWLEVGAVTLNAEREQAGTISHRSNAMRDQRRTYIKVEEIK